MKKALFFLASIVFLATASAQTSVQDHHAIVVVATHFVSTLTPEQVKLMQYHFDDTLRTKWTNLPVGLVPRAGLRYGALSENSRIAFHDMLATVLTSQGYLKVTGIMHLDDVLNLVFQTARDRGEMSDEQMKGTLDRMKWNFENYYFALWGTPDLQQAWGFTFGGHHLALTLTMKGSQIAFTPLFVGTDPSQVPSTKYAGWRVLSKEEDYGFSLLHLLTDAQRSKAVIAGATPKDIITNPNSSQRITSYYGIEAKEFNEDQMAVFKILVGEYLHNFEHDVAHDLYDKIAKTGFEKVYFAWIGGSERHTPHYYIINGPDFLIEYDNVGFRADGNHIHAILREKGNDFGGDILKDHYLNSKH